MVNFNISESISYESSAILESNKQELTFDISVFRNTSVYENIKAFALKLQELVLMEKGTNPNAVDMGCGIRNYLFEFLDDQTLSEMSALVSKQQRTYLPSELVKKIEFVTSGTTEDVKAVYMFVHLNSYDAELATNYFAVGFGNLEKTRNNIISSIYI